MLKNVVLQFDLPFVYRVVDSIRRETTPDGYQQYVFPIEGAPVMLRFEKKVRDLGGVSVATEDHHGMLSHSRVQVWFDSQTLAPMGITDNYRSHAEVLILRAIAAVNRFTEAYRRIVGAFWLVRITRTDIAQVHFVGRRKDGSEDPFVLGTLGTGIALGSLLKEEENQKLHGLLQSDWEEEDVQRMAYASQKSLDQGDYWTAALTSAIVFESSLARLLRNHFQGTGLTNPEIDKRFEFNDGRPRSVTNLIKEYVPGLKDAFSGPPTSEAEKACEAWATSARDLRNDIAHGKVFAVTKPQAEAAIGAVNRFLPIVAKALA